MLNYLWGGMIIIGIAFGAFTGKMPEITNAALDSAREAVTLSITMIGVMSFWVGMMEIATRAGIIEMTVKKMRPLIHFLFPQIPTNHKAVEYITTNFIANFLGLGWAATPAGLKGMSALADLEKERQQQGIKTVKPGVASDEMCTLLIMDISSLQLIPVNIIAYRSQYGSVNPAAIVGVGIAATVVSTMVAIVFCKVMNGSKIS